MLNHKTREQSTEKEFITLSNITNCLRTLSFQRREFLKRNQKKTILIFLAKVQVYTVKIKTRQSCWSQNIQFAISSKNPLDVPNPTEFPRETLSKADATGLLLKFKETQVHSSGTMKVIENFTLGTKEKNSGTLEKINFHSPISYHTFETSKTKPFRSFSL